MKITNEIKKFKIDVVKAINFMLANDTPLSLLINIASTPSIGVKSKDDNNMDKNKIKISSSVTVDGNVPNRCKFTIWIIR